MKIALIQKELKDKNFKNAEEKVNFQILKALSESDCEVDVFCIKNSLSKKLPQINILKLSEKHFAQNAFSIVNKMDCDVTFATEYFPTKMVYLHRHTTLYDAKTTKTKIEILFKAIFKNKEFKAQLKRQHRQKICTKRNKIIITPSMMLKNDLINNLQADGQKIYILPPAIDIPKKVNLKTNETFTFGFIGKNFRDKGGFILLNALKDLKNFDFKVKIIYPYEKIPKILNFYLKHYNLLDKVELIPYQDNMNDFYNTIDCLVLPSKKETFGLSILEAMSRGKLVIISTRCGAKDIIEHDNNGFIFDITKNPVRNLTRCLEYILINKDDFTGMQEKALYTAQVYNFEKFKQELIKIINKVVDTEE